MNKLTVIGLGCDENDITLSAINEIKGAKTLVVRTENTLSFNVLKTLGKTAISLDYVYEKSRSFKTLNDKYDEFRKMVELSAFKIN